MLSIPAQAFPSILLPISRHPALDTYAINEVVVFGGEVGVAVNEAGVAVGAQEVVGGAGVEVHQVALGWVGFGLFGVFALLA